MPDSASNGRVARFGVFKFDSGTGEICKNGSRRTLSGQPLQVLTALLEKPGEVVTRETLCKRLWPDGTFVDYDHSLRVAINRIRDALGDSAESPRFIETVRGRGWRFIAPVTWEEGNGAAGRETEPSNGLPLAEGKSCGLGNPAVLDGDRGSAASADGVLLALPPTETHRQRLTLRRQLRNAKFAGLALVAALALAYLFRPRGEPQVSGFTPLTYDGLKKSDGGPLLTDGSRVYFWEYRGESLALASVPVDGGEVAEVHVPPGFTVSDVSKGGSEFLGVDRTPDGALSLAIVSASGKSEQWLPQPRAPAGGRKWIPNPLWSPHRNRISFSLPDEVLEEDVDSERIRQIAHVDGWPNWPRWSPFGSKLVFSVLKPKDENFSLWQVDADGSHLHHFSFSGSGFTETCWGSWTPDGKWLVFEVERNQRRDIWGTPDMGERWSSPSKPVRLTSGPLNYFWPVSSLDGKEVFVLGEETRGELMRFDLKSRSFVDFLGGISATEVSFSRDGKWVAYVNYPDYTLWRARADGSDAHQLTYPPLEAHEPHWSPDDRQIAFQGVTRDARSAAPRYKVYLISSRGGIPQEAVEGTGEEGAGTW